MWGILLREVNTFRLSNGNMNYNLLNDLITVDTSLNTLTFKIEIIFL